MALQSDAWQVFGENGEPIPGKQVTFEEYAVTEHTMVGSVHLWAWRKYHGTVEILLQKRAKTMGTWPSYYDVSSAGHIDEHESVIDAVCREAKEEIGIDVQADDLYFVATLRSTPPILPELEFIYIYQINDSQTQPIPDEGEVAALRWVSIDDFRDMFESMKSDSRLVPHPVSYYRRVTEAIESRL